MDSIPKPRRKWLGIVFKCCQVYGRAYQSFDGKSYRGSCPRCMASVYFKVGVGGTDRRFFEAS